MPEDVAAFLNKYVDCPRVPVHLAGYRLGSSGFLLQRLTVEEMAKQLLEMSEFQALRLGTWLGTTDGEVIAQAVEMAMPPFYRADAELLIEALKLAAELQHRGYKKLAGVVVLGSMTLASFAMLAVRSSKD